VGQRGLAHTRHVLDQQMSARQQAHQCLPYLHFLANNDFSNLRGNGMNSGIHSVPVGSWREMKNGT
jgi:hypothetical protein